MARTNRTTQFAWAAGALIGLAALGAGAWAQPPTRPAGARGAAGATIDRDGPGETTAAPAARTARLEDLPKAAGDTLVIIADGDPDTAARTVATRIRLGVTKVLQELKLLPQGREFPEDQVRATQIDRETYEVLKRFINEGTIPRESAEAGLAMTSDPRGTWRLNLGGPYTLKQLDVEYEHAKTKKKSTKTFTPGSQEGNVKIVTIGRYLVEGVRQTDPEVVPVKFIVTAMDGDKELPPKELDVPRESTYWQVIVENFAGDQKRLFEVLADPGIMANTLVSKKLSERKLVLGSMLLDADRPEMSIADNLVKVSFYPPPNKSPNRVWMKFPVEPEEVSAELEKYKKFDEFELPAQILKESPSPASEAAVLTPRAGRWYEVLPSKDRLSFERQFRLDQLDAWKARGAKEVYELIVWQKDDGRGGSAQAFLLGDPLDERKPKLPLRVQEIKEWPVQIRGASEGTRR